MSEFPGTRLPIIDRIRLGDADALREALALALEKTTSQSEIVVLSSDTVAFHEYDFVDSSVDLVWRKSEIRSVFEHLLNQQLSVLRIDGLVSPRITLGGALTLQKLGRFTRIGFLEEPFQRGEPIC